MAYISAYFAPLIICVIVVVAMINTDDMFSQFVSGAKSGLHTVYSIAPSLIGLITAVEMMKAWYCFNALTGKDENCSDYIEFAQSLEPSEKKVRLS